MKNELFPLQAAIICKVPNCNFAVPYPLDTTSRALITAHLEEHKKDAIDRIKEAEAKGFYSDKETA